MLAGGLTLESIVNIAAASGIGKSSYINELIYHWIFNSPIL
jgi:putative ribosome biogenesis GTPase RsgA